MVPLFLLVGATLGLTAVMNSGPGERLRAALAVEHASVRDDREVRAGSPWNADYFTNTPVVTHDGRTLRFYDDLIKDKIVVVNFIYTSCSDICSLASARLAEVRELLGDRVGRDIFFYSITLDPAVDGPEVLKTYASHFYDGPGWLFLTGTPEDIDLIRYRLGERNKSRESHRNDLMLGNDRTGEWGRESIFTDVAQLAWTIRRMDPASRGEAFAAAEADMRDKMLVMPDTPGSALFAKACAGCHTIGGGEKVGPDLADVASRRDRDWLIRFIISPRALLAANDPTATALVAAYGGLVMPSVGLNETDAEDLLVYIGSRSEAARGGNTTRLVRDTTAPGD